MFGEAQEFQHRLAWRAPPRQQISEVSRADLHFFGERALATGAPDALTKEFAKLIGSHTLISVLAFAGGRQVLFWGS